MKVANYSEFRKNMKLHLDDVTKHNEVLVVHRQTGKTVVVMSLEDFNAWSETEYLLSSPANAKRLKQSVKELESGKTVKRKLAE